MDNPEREAAWMAYQQRLGNLSPREESMIERAFKAGWEASRLLTARVG